MRSAPGGEAGGRRGHRLLDAAVEAGVERVDEGLAVLEVDVEGALGDTGLGDDAVDAEAGEAVRLGDGDAGVEQRLAGAGSDAVVGACGGTRPRLH